MNVCLSVRLWVCNNSRVASLIFMEFDIKNFTKTWQRIKFFIYWNSIQRKFTWITRVSEHESGLETAWWNPQADRRSGNNLQQTPRWHYRPARQPEIRTLKDPDNSEVTGAICKKQSSYFGGTHRLPLISSLFMRENSRIENLEVISGWHHHKLSLHFLASLYHHVRKVQEPTESTNQWLTGVKRTECEDGYSRVSRVVGTPAPRSAHFASNLFAVLLSYPWRKPPCSSLYCYLLGLLCFYWAGRATSVKIKAWH